MKKILVFKISKGTVKWRIATLLLNEYKKSLDEIRNHSSLMCSSEVATKTLTAMLKDGVVEKVYDERYSLTKSAVEAMRKSIDSEMPAQAAPAYEFRPLSKKNMPSTLGTRPGSNEFRKWKSIG